MKIVTPITLSLLSVLFAGLPVRGWAADATPSGAPRIGEVRALALSPSSHDAIAHLLQDGWLEARGQLLPTKEYGGLFKVVGRQWTADDVAADRFAIPDLHDRFQQAISSDNPFGVLGPGDLVQGRGPKLKGWLRQAPISYWIFAGEDAGRHNAPTRK